MSEKVRSIKQAQRERLLLREVSELFLNICQEDKRLEGLFISKIGLSADRSLCSIYFYAPEGLKFFEEKLEVLKLYRPSMRTALAKRINTRYTPELVFKFDTLFAKQQRIDSIIDSIAGDSSS